MASSNLSQVDGQIQDSFHTDHRAGPLPPETRALPSTPLHVPPASPTVSIIVPCRNEKEHIQTSLRSILAQEPVPGECEIIVADGMSDDGTRDILQQLAEEDPRLRVIDNPGRIVSTGLNAAIAVARGTVIVRMDAHTEYAADYVRQCVTVLQETGADNVGGPVRTKGRGAWQSAICAAYHSPLAMGGARAHQVAYEGYVDTVPYGCWPRKVFDQIGLFDEELIRNQDDELNLRLTRMGGKIWQAPRIQSWYSPRRSLRSLFRQYLQYGYWKVRVIQKHRRPASVRHLVPGSFVLCLSLLPVVSLWWPPAGWAWLGLVGIYGLSTLAVSLLIAARQDWRLLPLLPLVFACYHVSYGAGFLCGIWDFVFLPGVFQVTATQARTRYLLASLDANQQSFDGGKTYRVTLPKDIPAANFWSLTVYDNMTRAMLDTPPRDPRAGSQSSPLPAAEANADGSTTIYFGPMQPDGIKRGNWIQTMPDKGWFVILRLYSPLEPFFAKTWRPSEIELVQ